MCNNSEKGIQKIPDHDNKEEYNSFSGLSIIDLAQPRKERQKGSNASVLSGISFTRLLTGNVLLQCWFTRNLSILHWCSAMFTEPAIWCIFSTILTDNDSIHHLDLR
jgi:hypothetical protein